MKKYFIITFGCQMNKSDSERITAVLEKSGYKKSPLINEADLIVVNMCSVRQSAVDRVYGLLPRLRQGFGGQVKLKIILTGCILKKDRKKFTEKFDFVLELKDLSKWHKKLRYRRPVHGTKNCEIDYLALQPKYSNNFSAFVPIMTGCNNFCAYCVVPYVKGPEFSRPAEEIICEVKNLIKKNYKEIWLLGQNVNSYRINHRSTQIRTRINTDVNFTKLLKMVNDIPGNFWIRFTSSHPKDFSDELIETMADCKKVTEYLNLPVQAGDDKILKKMNRSYTVAQYKNLVKKIRKKIPNIALSTDIIVGFPGETKKQFENTVKLFKKIKFDMAYISKYSPRPETAAAQMKDNVSQKEKNRREKVLTEILKKTALKNNRKYIGKEVEILVEELRIKNKELRIIFGRTRSYKKVKILDSKFSIPNSNLIGKFIKIKIVDALPWGLKGKLVS